MAGLIKQSDQAVALSRSAGIGFAERIESIKAGTWGALSAGVTFGGLALVNDRLPYLQALAGSSINIASSTWLSWAIATLSGFLFGVTYRYIVRQDQNPHLRSGAVLAFGLVRGLAQVDTIAAQVHGLTNAAIVVESILLFATAQVTLDWAIAQGWVKSFR